MQLYYENGKAVDMTNSTVIKNIKQEHLVSVLHFNDSDNITRDECDNEWIMTDGIYASTDYSIYKNTVCIPSNGENSLYTKNPIPLKYNSFTIEFWMKCVNGKSYYTNTEYQTDDNLVLEISFKNYSIIKYYNNGSISVNDDITKTGTGLSINNIISVDNSLQHFLISYSQNMQNILDLTERRVSEWINGNCMNWYTNFPYMDLRSGISIKFTNKLTTANKPVYISNFRLWDGLTVHNPGEEMSATNLSAKKFSEDLTNLKLVGSKVLTYENFILNKNNGIYKKYEAPDLDYKTEDPTMNEITVNDDTLIYMPFSRSINLLEDTGSLSTTWSIEDGMTMEKINSAEYEIYDQKAILPHGIGLYTTAYIDGTNYGSRGYIGKVLSKGHLKSNDINIFNYSKFTIEFFTGILSISNVVVGYGTSTPYTYNPFHMGYRIFGSDTLGIGDTGLNPGNTRDFHHFAVVYTGGDSIRIYKDGISTEYEIIKKDSVTPYITLGKMTMNTPTSEGYLRITTNGHLQYYLGHFRMRNDEIYTEDFDPMQKLFTYNSDIMEYLNSTKRELEEDNIMLKYPVENPITLYDYAQSKNSAIKFSPEYDSTLKLSYNGAVCALTTTPDVCKNLLSILSGTNFSDTNFVKFRVDKLVETDYKIQFYAYIKYNKTSTDFKTIFVVSGTSSFVAIRVNSSKEIKISYSLSLKYTTAYDIPSTYPELCTERVYNTNTDNVWVHFTLECSGTNMKVSFESPTMTVSTDITDWSRKYLHRILIPTGMRRDGNITVYYTGITASVITS